MNDDPPFEVPEVTADDISWVADLLKLPADAFCGKDGLDPRRDVLNTMETIDVVACPGSGKTTLLVAKLAILAKKWRYRTRGICVLSHTNVARSEIETRLGHTSAGQCLLSYPHFIGTIHGFVNEFLALPYLRALGYPIKVIDTDICLNRRWINLSAKTRRMLEQYHHDHFILSIKSPDFNVGEVRWGKGHLGLNTAIYREIRDVCRRSTEAGYFCHDEMFMWAGDLMDQVPGVIDVIRDRFPLLFVDEAQDNSEEQSAILYRIFLNDGHAVIRQRFGDSNQAIFDSIGTDEATTDRFPNDAIKKDLPSSHRFGQRIADLADPLGLIPYGLKGHGPKRPFASGVPDGPHTIFLFDDDSIARIMNAYGDLLIETFSEQELREGTFKVVGQIHKEKGEGHKPRHVGHYWPDYDSELTVRDPRPQTFVQYVFAGMEKAAIAGEIYLSVGKIAEGILRLARMVEQNVLTHRKNCHRHILELLEEHADTRTCYEDLIANFAVRREVLTKVTWDGHWRSVVLRIGETIAGASLSGAEVNDFLTWKDRPNDSLSARDVRTSRDNIYRHSKDGKEVTIQVGSIHSVKGETHTATLVLETFWYDHNLESLVPWLEGSKVGGQSDGARQKSRLKIHYVAMTRPTHLLCLAMKASTFKDGTSNLDRQKIQNLERHGWKVKLI